LILLLSAAVVKAMELYPLTAPAGSHQSLVETGRTSG